MVLALSKILRRYLLANMKVVGLVFILMLFKKDEHEEDVVDISEEEVIKVICI